MGTPTLPADLLAEVRTKLIVEPNDFTYRGPSTKLSRGALGNLVTRLAPSTNQSNVTTFSVAVNSIQILKSDDDKARAVFEHGVTARDSLITQWVQIVDDAATRSKIDAFHSQLNKLLSDAGKKGTLSVSDVQAVVKAMQPYNIGMVWKLRLQIVTVTREEFPKSSLAPDGLYHRTVKSKVAYAPYSAKLNKEELEAHFHDVFIKALEGIKVVSRGDALTRRYVVVDKQGPRGQTYKSLQMVMRDDHLEEKVLALADEE